MICEVCKKNEATIVFQIFSGGQLATRTICAQCAMKAQSDLTRTLWGIGMHLQERTKEEAEISRDEAMPTRFCSACGSPVSKIDEDTVLGCPNCYDALDENEAAVLAKGREKITAPEVAEVPEDIKTTIEQMAHKLREAIVSEDFEQAASLRDQINKATLSGQIGDE